MVSPFDLVYKQAACDDGGALLLSLIRAVD